MKKKKYLSTMPIAGHDLVSVAVAEIVMYKCGSLLDAREVQACHKIQVKGTQNKYD